MTPAQRVANYLKGFGIDRIDHVAFRWLCDEQLRLFRTGVDIPLNEIADCVESGAYDCDLLPN